MNLRKGMSMDDLISIVLPIYNGEKYMKQSIDSVINQTYANWELLIVDGGQLIILPLLHESMLRKIIGSNIIKIRRICVCQKH